ncbi:HupE/UreJ family protein, partial [Loigolactobacillus coryniformis]|uniref:HupE/UreJ family protein n=1 Tax=Loigolactobacillus coryniformis TaxID=1610 RepID=UPI00201B2033
AFTIGHSITLALATLRVVEYSTDVVELLIPITILITAIVNFFHDERPSRFDVGKRAERSWSRYGFAVVFGLIHGLGFSNYLRSLL